MTEFTIELTMKGEEEIDATTGKGAFDHAVDELLGEHRVGKVVGIKVNDHDAGEVYEKWL